MLTTDHAFFCIGPELSAIKTLEPVSSTIQFDMQYALRKYKSIDAIALNQHKGLEPVDESGGMSSYQHCPLVTPVTDKLKEVLPSHTHKSMETVNRVTIQSQHKAVLTKVTDKSKEVLPSVLYGSVHGIERTISPASLHRVLVNRALEKSKEVLPSNVHKSLEAVHAGVTARSSQNPAVTKAYDKSKAAMIADSQKPFEPVTGTLPSVLTKAEISTVDAARYLPTRKALAEAEAAIINARQSLYRVKGDYVEVSV